MNMNEYQKLARTTANYPKDYSVIYPVLGLNGEAGEVAEKLKKIIRDKEGEISPEDTAAIVKELGDVLWYLSNIASDLKVSLDDVAVTNIEKLSSRVARGKLSGSGDDR